MTYVIAEPCIGEKAAACVDVCPAACIHTTPDAAQNYIDPDVCIECEQCVLVCPVDAVFLDVELPDEWRHYAQVNADFFRANKIGQHIPLTRAISMVEAVREYARRSGIVVAAVVVDRAGRPLAADCMEGAAPSAPEQAEQKAYTAVVYRLGTHQLQPGQSRPRSVDTALDAARVLMHGGGFPLVEGGEVVGAIGVAGSPTPAQDILCCQAALGALDGTLR